ncbi:MAG: alanine--tRNA ligase [Candidatus Marinimicrobia bacterium]|nr:alanine--tRNA ligase [Candidatus Neomarinimicrobiota bacterium]
MDTKTVRQQFIDFFKERDHSFVRSTPVVPVDDPTLLFTNAGMNQFKNIFLGKEEVKYPRVVNSQKCIRVSGKHNDLEEVGYDTFHHTFFEMLGNWSFGDYYKEEAIRWAWELFTEVWELPKERLWATVFKEDNESEELWKNVTDIDPNRVLKFGKRENFWEMGETGPCGPCSEIHYYVGKDVSKQNKKGINVSDQYWELWNLVFIQSNCMQDGSLESLSQKHIDTGAGLERIAAVLQHKTSNYQSDLFQPIIREVERLTDTLYKNNPVPHRVIVDHLRMMTFAIADGVLPSNEGRGYVVRRILRRAARFSRNLGVHEPFIYRLVPTIIDMMGDIYPELIERKIHIEKVIKVEEESFNATLDRGLENFQKILADLTADVIPGDKAFKLYDTFGFPLDLTQQMAREKGLLVDLKGFEQEMQAQRERARSSARFHVDVAKGNWVELTKGKDSEFIGYDEAKSKVQIRRYLIENGKVFLILDRTPFYGESGGQIGDAGFIRGERFTIEVVNTVKEGENFIHIGKMMSGDGIESPEVTAEIDINRRNAIKLNHTATHLMHKALKLVLGDHVHQAGSLVHSDYLRFDLTHYEKMTPEQIRKVEEIVNREIRENIPIEISYKDFEKARQEGAVALFGEKYGEKVRVVSAGDFSKELCGGTHVTSTGEIGFFKITEESSLAAGVRRIFAMTGSKAVDYILNGFDILSQVQELLNCSKEQVIKRVSKLLYQKKVLEKRLRKKQTVGKGDVLISVMKECEEVNGRNVVASVVDVIDMDHLKNLGDQLLTKLKSGIGVLGGVIDDKPNLVCVVTKDLNKKGIKAGDLARKFGQMIGGGGGGKPHLATAGGKNPDVLNDVIKKIKKESVKIVRGNE